MKAGSNKDVAGVTGSSSCCDSFLLCIYYNHIETERLVLNLYNQGKNIREIAEEARMSFSAIGAILKKAEKESEARREQTVKLSLSSQAYKLFSERRTSAQVAIALNLRQPEVTEFYMEYCNLTQLESLCRIYDKIKDDIYPFLRLYMLSKVARMDAQHVVKLLTIANDDLPAAEYRYQELKREEASLKALNHNSAIILKDLSNHISELSNTRDSFSHPVKKKDKCVSFTKRKLN
jgi:hypothetical protein